MRLFCPHHPQQVQFVRQAYDDQGHKQNAELVNQYGCFQDCQVDYFRDDLTYRYLCLECGLEAQIDPE
jgi:hypothetical protein